MTRDKSKITYREMQITTMIAAGHTALKIGEQFKISPKTVESTKQRVKTKLGIKDRVEWVNFLRSLPVPSTLSESTKIVSFNIANMPNLLKSLPIRVSQRVDGEVLSHYKDGTVINEAGEEVKEP